jgi:REP element-mobilizing transposase RayT
MSRPPRIKGFDYLGPYRYFLTFCTIDRSTPFRNPSAAELVLTQFRSIAGASSFALLAYCLMPDHVHLLAEGKTADADLKRFAKRLKQATGQAWAFRTGSRLWQEGYYDRVLRPGDDAKAVARYIVGNPVRAGLAASPAEYPYVGLDVWTLDELMESVM